MLRLAYWIFPFHAAGSTAATLWWFGTVWGATTTETQVAKAVTCAFWQPLIWWMQEIDGLEDLVLPLLPVNSALAALLIAWIVHKLRGERAKKPRG